MYQSSEYPTLRQKEPLTPCPWCNGDHDADLCSVPDDLRPVFTDDAEEDAEN